MGRRPKEPISPRLGTDRTHTIASLLFSGAAEQFPDVKWIFSHAGGPAPFLMQRFTYDFAGQERRGRLVIKGVANIMSPTGRTQSDAK